MGATSAIAEAAAREFARRGEVMLLLVGRSGERLGAIAADLKCRGAAAVDILVHDARDVAGFQGLVDTAAQMLGGLDVALIAHGTLSDQHACEQSVELMLTEIELNALSVVALCTVLANRFEAQRAGVIAVISSVAGERGRQSNYVYGAAKALVTAFLSGIRQRLRRSGVAVVTIKPGFVDTPMTAEFKKGPLWASPDRVAKAIVRSILRGTPVVYIPWFWRPIMAVIRALPESIFLRLRL
jgi:decaprenylphospho-beta-D-erythro-pentofuranosid-2-ulose 2-reductase